MSPTLWSSCCRMASVEIPGKPNRWGNESTNFYQGSFMKRPGSASPLNVYRCHGSFYTNSGSLHVGTKIFNQRQPLDRYGTASAYKLRMEDQRLPRPLTSQEVHYRKLKDNSKVDLYQSHQHHYSQYSMGTKQRPHSAGPSVPSIIVESNSAVVSSVPAMASLSTNTGHGHSTAQLTTNLYDSLSKSFYITSYQKQISQPINTSRISRTRSMPPSSNNPYSLSAAMISTVPIRPLSASSKPQSYSSKSDFLKELSSKYPSPLPQPSSERAQRPSSATLLRRGSIPHLRT